MTILDIVQIIISILLIITILLQQRGGGLSGVFGGGESSAYSTRRGAEKGIFVTSMILATLFILTAALRLFL